jgi:DNA helicase-2/ATP-dependent DNA helicase PcrA
MNLQVIACAGSGKTAVAAERVARVLVDKHSRGIRPCNIVAFTFTERAASELKDRISATVGPMTGMADM